jgi:hypothetical protein
MELIPNWSDSKGELSRKKDRAERHCFVAIYFDVAKLMIGYRTD